MQFILVVLPVWAGQDKYSRAIDIMSVSPEQAVAHRQCCRRIAVAALRLHASNCRNIKQQVASRSGSNVVSQ